MSFYLTVSFRNNTPFSYVGGRNGGMRLGDLSLGVFVEEKSFLYLYTDDDSIVLMEPGTFSQMEVSKDLFGKAAAYLKGLKVNRDKSEVIPVGRVDYLENIVSVLGCRIGNLPSSYLGLPLGAPFKSPRVWDVVEERFRKRLSLWKRQYLSKGGRLTLIKSTLSSLPIYLMSLLVIPRKVCARLEKIQETSCGAVAL
ncbi:hypothetical protein CK203_076116 [Vitis vinifera]|uniref:Translation elongation factor P/YeiP central domain-containing protein n=1 Tax=Vitis vinifera TaxID=29760 RepID=A0A438EMB1_VITVI|nr:hypothetical protein CK203_076116 [Vitis vinifera]